MSTKYILHTARCYISVEVVREIWNWSLLGVRRVKMSLCCPQVVKLATTENINCRDTQGRNSTPLHLAGTCRGGSGGGGGGRRGEGTPIYKPTGGGGGGGSKCGHSSRKVAKARAVRAAHLRPELWKGDYSGNWNYLTMAAWKEASSLGNAGAFTSAFVSQFQNLEKRVSSVGLRNKYPRWCPSRGGQWRGIFTWGRGGLCKCLS